MSFGPVMLSRIPVAPSIEVEVDEPRHRDQVGDPLHALAEDVVRHPERLHDRRLLLDHLEEPVVLDHDQRVDAVAEGLDAALRLLGAPASLEGEGPGDDTDGERVQLTGELGEDRRAPGSRAAALAGGDEDHVRALERFLQLVAALVRGGLAHHGIGACAEPARDLRADVDLDVGVAHEQRLRVGVHRDELDPGEAGIDHPVDGVRAAAADADDLDDCQVIARLISHSRPASASTFGGASDARCDGATLRVRRFVGSVNGNVPVNPHPQPAG
jgi:hypothetical protein